MKYVLLLVVSLLSVGCDMLSKGSLTAPESVASEDSSAVSPQLVRALAGEGGVQRWTGLQGPEAGCPPEKCGEGGGIQMTFTSLNPDAIHADLEYIALSGQHYRGAVTGTIDGMIILVDPSQNVGGTICGYRARGALTTAINGQPRLEGSFEGFGPGPNCTNKRGWFWLHGDLPPPPPPKVCEEVKPLVFPARQVMINWPLPMGGDKREDAFAVPAGTWAINAVTGDNHSEKPGEAPQTGEKLWFLFKDAAGVIASTPPTDDVPEDVDVKATSLGDVILTRPATHVETRHAGPTILEGGIQTDSVYPVLLTAACPVP